MGSDFGHDRRAREDGGVTEQKSALQQALDLVFYAPVGLAITAREELPRLIGKGRQRVTGQVAMARMIGQFALNKGQHEASKVAKQAGDMLAGLGIIPGGTPPPSAPAEPEARAERLERSGVARAPTGAPAPVASTNGKPVDRLARSGASSGGLAIPGYDSLSASQVVQRLAGLVPTELEAVRDYEASTRGRRTILNRIAQLQTGSA
jgi:hypothetical protein